MRTSSILLQKLDHFHFRLFQYWFQNSNCFLHLVSSSSFSYSFCFSSSLFQIICRLDHQQMLGLLWQQLQLATAVDCMLNYQEVFRECFNFVKLCCCICLVIIVFGSFDSLCCSSSSRNLNWNSYHRHLYFYFLWFVLRCQAFPAPSATTPHFHHFDYNFEYC